jgi:cell division protein FtsB
MKFNLLTLLLIVLALCFLFQIREDLLTERNLFKEKEMLLAKIEVLTAENEKLASDILKSDKNVERLARERLNLIKKGEIAYKVCQ